jgi:hypothetical protein
MIIFTFCLCCHPTQKDTEYYKRLAYYDEAWWCFIICIRRNNIYYITDNYIIIAYP